MKQQNQESSMEMRLKLLTLCMAKGLSKEQILELIEPMTKEHIAQLEREKIAVRLIEEVEKMPNQ